MAARTKRNEMLRNKERRGRMVGGMEVKIETFRGAIVLKNSD